jgi:hypothetical protein
LDSEKVVIISSLFLIFTVGCIFEFKINNLKLLEFHQKNFSADRLTLVGLGIGHDYLLQFAESFKLPNSASDQSHSSKYFASKISVFFQVLNGDHTTYFYILQLIF